MKYVKEMKMKRRNLVLMLLVVAMLFVTAVASADEPKYVFFFLGDGMANSQIQATEAYLTTVNGGSATLADRSAEARKPAEHEQNAGAGHADDLRRLCPDDRFGLCGHGFCLRHQDRERRHRHGRHQDHQLTRALPSSPTSAAKRSASSPACRWITPRLLPTMPA